MLRRFALTAAFLATLLLGNVAFAAEHGNQAGAHAEKPVVNFDPTQAIWVVVIFVILLIILYPTAWKSVLAGLKAREDRIRKDIADAEAARAKAEATLKEYSARLADAESKVREMIAGAVAQGEKLAADMHARAQQEGDDLRQRAANDIEAAKSRALSEIYEKAAELSTSIASKILQRNINADDQRDLVRQSLDQLQNVR